MKEAASLDSDRLPAGRPLDGLPESIRQAAGGHLTDPDVVSLVLTDCRVPDHPAVWISEGFERLTGYRKDETIGRNCRFLQGDDRDQEGCDRIRRAVDQAHPVSAVLRNYRKDGSPFWNLMQILPVLGASGMPTHFLGLQHRSPASRLMDAVGAALEKARIEQSRIVDYSTDIVCRVGRDGTILEINRAAHVLWGWPPGVLHGKNLLSTVAPEDLAAAQGTMRDVLAGARLANEMVTHLAHNGSRVIIEWSAVSISAAGSGMLCIGRDVTQRERLRAELVQAKQQTDRILRSITDAFMSFDRDWCFVYLNPQAEAMLERRGEELLGRRVWKLFPQSVDSVFYRTYLKAAETQSFQHCQAYYAPLRKWVEARAYPHGDGLTVLLRDLTADKAREAKLEHLAGHDTLTDLANRRACLETLQVALQAADGGAQARLAVLYIDLDRFKEINDALGHQAGDRVLVAVAALLLRAVGRQGETFRIGGDEFVVLLKHAGLDDAVRVARRILAYLREPISTGQGEASLGASIGIAMHDAQSTADELLNQADAAMYEAKTAGRFGYRISSTHVAAHRGYKGRLRTEMPEALRRGEFVLHYQSKVSLADGRLQGAEALVRWQHPEFGLLAPAEFLDIAEESPMILRLGRYVLDAACCALGSWTALCPADFKLSVNLSARDLCDPQLPTAVQASMGRFGVSSERLDLEITESMLMSDVDAATDVLAELERNGLSVSLDDFGTGYSNLSYLMRFPIRALKIDRSFVRELGADPQALRVVQAIVALGKSLQLDLVAEGVETDAQRALVAAAGCDSMQGYLVSRPISGADFERLLSAGAGREQARVTSAP